MDMLAAQLFLDPLEFRRRNALGVGSITATGQVLGEGAALPQCLDALRPGWKAMRDHAAAFNATTRTKLRRGAGLACMWYGIGNTSLSNPSEMVIGLTKAARIVLFSARSTSARAPTPSCRRSPPTRSASRSPPSTW